MSLVPSRRHNRPRLAGRPYSLSDLFNDLKRGQKMYNDGKKVYDYVKNMRGKKRKRGGGPAGVPRLYTNEFRKRAMRPSRRISLSSKKMPRNRFKARRWRAKKKFCRRVQSCIDTHDASTKGVGRFCKINYGELPINLTSDEDILTQNSTMLYYDDQAIPTTYVQQELTAFTIAKIYGVTHCLFNSPSAATISPQRAAYSTSIIGSTNNRIDPNRLKVKVKNGMAALTFDNQMTCPVRIVMYIASPKTPTNESFKEDIARHYDQFYKSTGSETDVGPEKQYVSEGLPEVRDALKKEWNYSMQVKVLEIGEMCQFSVRLGSHELDYKDMFDNNVYKDFQRFSKQFYYRVQQLPRVATYSADPDGRAVYGQFVPDRTNIQSANVIGVKYEEKYTILCPDAALDSEDRDVLCYNTYQDVDPTEGYSRKQRIIPGHYSLYTQHETQTGS